MLKSLLQRFKAGHYQVFQAQKGQSIIIVTFAFLGLIAMLGLALDLGLVYIEQVRVSRTADAASLAGVVELPFEEEAMRRAIEFIELNGYNVGPDGDTTVLVRGCVDVWKPGDPEPPRTRLRNVNAAGESAPTSAVPITPTQVITDGYALPQFTSGENPPRAVFIVDTLSYQPVDFNADGSVKTKNNETCSDSTAPFLYGTANKLRVAGRVNVDMNFMQFFGFDEVPVQDEALGENVTSLDVVIVFDVSGSMDFETTCFGCWSKYSSSHPNYDPVDNPFPSNGAFNALDYVPDDDTYGSTGGPYDIFWDNRSGPLAAGHPVCADNPASLVFRSENYLVHEAEFYSYDFPTHGWEFEQRTPGQGFWVLQRLNNRGSNEAHIRAHVYPTYSQSDINNWPQLQGASYNSECFDNTGGVGSLSGECWETRATSLGQSAPSTVPWVEYDFAPDWTGDAYFWVRAIGGSGYSYQWYGAGAGALTQDRDKLYWQVDNGPIQGGDFTGVQGGDHTTVDNSDWRWVKLGSTATAVTAGTQYTLKLYQGSSGFRVDKIVITSNSEGSGGTAIANDGSGGSGLDIKDLLIQNSGNGPDATKGSATREACNVCNPMFGQTVDPANCSCKLGPGDSAASAIYEAGGAGIGCTDVTTTTNQLSNDLFHDVDPIRSAKEAVKNFVARLDPKFDQVGFVAFTTNVKAPREKLQCLRYASSRYGDQKYCHSADEPGQTRPISYTRIIRAVEAHNDDSMTDISEGMREGLEELGITTNDGTVDSDCNSYTSYGANGDQHACDRRGAARRVLVLLTDGSPNQNVTFPSSYTWNGNFGAGRDSYDAAMYFAKQASDNNVVVYTIGIGSGVNRDLLTAMATGEDPGTGDVYFGSRGGQYFPAARPSDLDGIFEQILSNIFVRIVG